jgi:hypothetical protein
MGPLNGVFHNERLCRLVRDPSEEGIDPLIKVPSRDSEYRFESDPIEEGSEPDMLVQ